MGTCVPGLHVSGTLDFLSSSETSPSGLVGYLPPVHVLRQHFKFMYHVPNLAEGREQRVERASANLGRAKGYECIYSLLYLYKYIIMLAHSRMLWTGKLPRGCVCGCLIACCVSWKQHWNLFFHPINHKGCIQDPWTLQGTQGAHVPPPLSRHS
jgi:hypothetical protein